MTESTATCMERVANRRMARTVWSAKKVALVATRRVGVVPGVKMDVHRFSMNSAMIVLQVYVRVGVCGEKSCKRLLVGLMVRENWDSE